MCHLERTGIIKGETIIEYSAIHCNVEVRLESTDVDDICNRMVDRRLEAKVAFKR